VTVIDEDFRDLIDERYERTSTVLSNLDFTEWDDAFATNKMLGAATLDGLCEALTMCLNSTAAHPGERTFGRANGFKSDIVNDEQRHLSKRLEAAFVGADSLRVAQRPALVRVTQ
jgi:hypothetical protein